MIKEAIGKRICKNVTNEEYKNTLYEVRRERIKSRSHLLGILNVNKISLSSFDDKRYIIDDETKTLSPVYKDIN